MKKVLRRCATVLAVFVLIWVPIALGFAIGVQMVAGGFDPETVELLFFLAYEGIKLGAENLFSAVGIG